MIPRGERRLAGLDGIRGLAALFVVVNRIFLSAFPGHLVDRAPFWAGWAIYGRFAVVVFIVMNPVRWRRSPSGALRRRLPRPQQAPA
jgi:peptidoglycan/LPS O-acetylase OafA/YrhL